MIEPVTPGFQLLNDVDHEDPYERLFEIVARAGAVRADRATLLAGDEEVWRYLVQEGYLLERHPKYGLTTVQVLTVSNKGRDSFKRVTDERADYVGGPQSVANRAHQAETLLHLAPEFEVTEVVWEAPAGLPRGETQRARTDQILHFRVRPRGSAATGERAPLLYPLGASSPVTRKRIEQLLTAHRQNIVHWGHPLVIAVPEMTPVLEALMTALRRQVAAGKLSSFNVPRLVVVPPPCAPSRQS